MFGVWGWKLGFRLAALIFWGGLVVLQKINKLAVMNRAVRLLFAAVAVFMASCGGGGEKTTYQMKDVEFTLAGPLFEGANPVQYTVQVDLKAILGDKYLEGMKITGATLKNATLKAADSANFDGVSSFVLSLASDNKDLNMKELAVLNPVKAGSSSVVLAPSTEATAGEFFGEKQFYIVVDAALAKDMDSDLSFKGDFEFELTYK